MDILPFEPKFVQACLAIFDSNMPDFFHPGERPGLERFLAAPHHPFWVLVNDGVVLACGGFDHEPGAAFARIHWGMVHRDWHGKGLGRLLLLYRLREIGRISGVNSVQVGTTPQSAPFFEKQGFRVTSIEKDGWGAGFDRVEMVKKLSVCP